MGKAASSPVAAVIPAVAGIGVGVATGNPALGFATTAGVSGVFGAATSIEGNKEAEKAQKAALKEELRQSRQVANLEDDQLTKSLALADAQSVERLTLQTQQAAVAAGQDLADVESNLETERVDAAQKATQIRRDLLATLGEQSAVMASRHVLLGQTGQALDKEARRISSEDMRFNDLNLAQSQADAAGERRKISTSLTNSVRSGILGLTQQRATTALSQEQTRAATTLDLQNQERAAKIGYKSTQEQTRYVNQGALMSGFTNLTGIAADYYMQRKAIEPTSRQAPTYATPPRLTTRGPGGTLGGGV